MMISPETQNVFNWITKNKEWRYTFQECSNYEEFIILMHELGIISTPDGVLLNHYAVQFPFLNCLIE
jgi:hypothetical protein